MTDSDKIPVSFKCKKCGTKLQWSEDSIDTTEIKCQNCGEHFGTYLDLRNAALEAVRDKAVSSMKDAFKRR